MALNGLRLMFCPLDVYNSNIKSLLFVFGLYHLLVEIRDCLVAK